MLPRRRLWIPRGGCFPPAVPPPPPLGPQHGRRPQNPLPCPRDASWGSGLARAPAALRTLRPHRVTQARMQSESDPIYIIVDKAIHQVLYLFYVLCEMPDRGNLKVVHKTTKENNIKFELAQAPLTAHPRLSKSAALARLCRRWRRGRALPTAARLQGGPLSGCSQVKRLQTPVTIIYVCW